mgnify:CR=1 FL=1
MTDPSASIVTIGGSPSAVSRTNTLIDHLQSQLEANGHSVTNIRVRELDAAALLQGRTDSDSIQRAVRAVNAARGVIIATPVYKASYTGVLKVFLDVLPQNALAGKVVLPVVGGGWANHALVLDYALKPVLAALGASVILPGAFLLDSEFVKHPDGFSLSDELQEKTRDLFHALGQALSVIK